jgi:carboxyl-terminal processing protease
MKNKKWILAAVALSVGLGSGYQPARSQETGSNNREKSATGQQATRSKISQADMLKVEKALKAKGYDPGPVDGKADKETQAAIRAFQEKNNLTASGNVDQPTAEALEVVIIIAE